MEQTMQTPEFQNRVELNHLRQSVEDIRKEIGQIIVGQHEMINLIIVGLLSDGHMLIEGVPGIAKTLTAKLVAKTMSIKFSRIQFTPDLMPSDVIGTSVFNIKNSEFEFHQGPIFANIVLIDEINRAPAKTQAALFECMQEKQVTVDGKTYTLPPPFIVLATQNPIEQEGTYRLPEAQLDRFMCKIEISYPKQEEEILILKNHHEKKGNFSPEQIQPVLTGEQLLTYRNIVQSIQAEDKLIEYIASIVSKTRGHKSLFLGASPRASLAILTGAKAYAAIHGKDFITPDDIKFIASPVLAHRILLTPEKEMEGATTTQIVHQILESVEVPR
ncbi:MAG: MoxR family ATPase [Flavobacteriales bacterium]|nr:MoxR family ATPase [Flavobacteriales bacterium]MCZ2444129.1 MoxR family ATPase [Flavobacteriales bacterium]